MADLIFVHNRKAAGTSVKAFLGNNQIPFRILDEWNDDVLSRPGVVSFGVCRHPFDRVMSAWKYCDSTRHRSLLDCLIHPPRESDEGVGVATGHDFRHFTKLQSDYLFSEDRRKTVTHMLRFETLRRDLYQMVGLTPLAQRCIDFQRLNVGYDRIAHPHVLTAVERQMIYQLYYDDFELLGYSPDEF